MEVRQGARALAKGARQAKELAAQRLCGPTAARMHDPRMAHSDRRAVARVGCRRVHTQKTARCAASGFGPQTVSSGLPRRQTSRRQQELSGSCAEK